MKFIYFKILFLILFVLFELSTEIKLKRVKGETKKSGGHSIGTNLYSSKVTTKSMKRPLYWYFNVMLEKPSEKYAQEAENNGIRYQTDSLQESLAKEYDGYVRDNFDEKLNVFEQKLVTGNHNIIIEKNKAKEDDSSTCTNSSSNTKTFGLVQKSS